MISITSKSSKIALAAVIGLALAVALFAGVSVQKASAQGMTLSQLVDLFISLGIISPDKAAAARSAVTGSATAGTLGSFLKDLTVGSSGADVTSLQNRLGVSPATGYFGSITKAAVVSYQVANGVPGTGYVGPLTRAKLNGGAVVVTPGVTPVTPGVTTTIVNTGVEGTISATQSNSGIVSTAYEGENMVPVLGIELKAKNSDISVQRVKLQLGTATTIYNKIYDTVYITDGSTILAQADLNSNTVVKDGSYYYITLAGFNDVIARNSSKVLIVKVDVKAGIDSTDIDTEEYTIKLASQGVRGVDQAGIDQYTATETAGSETITRAINVNPTLAESATFTVSTNASTPKKANVIASEGSSDNELDKVTFLMVDFKAEKDNVLMTDLVVDVTKTSTGAATTSTIYVYDGSTELDSASVNTTTGSATFSDIDVLVSKGTTKTLTIKQDVRSANATAAVLAADIDTADVTAENSLGDSITETGSAAGETMYVTNVGALATLVSKSIEAQGAPQRNGVGENVSTSTLSATFSVKITAVGSALQFGTTASSTPMFSTTSTSFKIYRGGVYDSTIGSYATTTDWATPSGVTTTNLTNTWSLAEGTSVTVPVTFAIQGRTATAVTQLTAGLYSVGLEGIQPNAPYAITFMAGEADWRTSSVTFP